MFSSNTSSAEGGYQISRSLRFNSADSAYLNRTPASAGNRKTWTWSSWVKLNKSATQNILTANIFSSGSDSLSLRFYLDTATLQIFNNGSGTSSVSTTAVFRDYSAWYHIVFAVDTTQATASDRVKIYINGVQQATTGTITLNYDTPVNSSSWAAGIGAWNNGSFGMDGYLTEINFIDGQALTPSSFGQTNGNTGVWEPKRYSGSYGTNGFYLTFQDNSGTTSTTLGKDYSGNGNNWTPNNFSVTAGAGNDSLVDTPTPYGVDTGAGGTVRGNYATWNPLVVNKPTLTNGNLDADGSDLKTAISTMGVSSGKWYWEITIGSGTNTPNMGVTSFANDNADPGVYLGVGRSYVSGSGVYKNYTATSTVADSDFSNANTAGAVIGFALDCDAGTLAYYVNNVLGHTDTTVAAGTVLYPMTCNFNSTANNYRNTSVNFGQRPFAYTAPSGFKALCTQNLPTPTIGATSTTQAGDYFNPVLYTGTGATRTVTGVNFAPDFVWIKSRSAAYNNRLYDRVRGVENVLQSNTTAAEASDGGGLTAFGSDGFTLGSSVSQNENGSTFVAWNWKANGAGSSNTAGSITSTVSANTTSGFSIVTYTGTGANATIGHGLGVAPRMIIVKRRDAADIWPVYHESIGNTQYLRLQGDNPAGTFNVWQNTSPTSSVFYISTDSTVNTNTGTYVAYCFAEVAGYSKFGSYTGNGSSDGPFVYCGFRPKYVLVKRSDDSWGWWVFDGVRSPYNAVDKYLSPNLSDAEYTANIMDFTSNGFKIREASQGWNGSGGTIIFAAFAEFPQKFSLAR